MSLTPPRRLANHLRVPTDVTRVSRLWEKVRPRPRARRVAALFAFAAAALVALGVGASWRARASSPALVDVAPQAKSGVMTLPDGSRVLLGESSHARIDRAEAATVEVTLDEGSATFEVRHDPSRVFLVHVGSFDVLDLGTRFRVSRDERAVSVSVEQGRVEVRDRGGDAVRTLGAGESWTSAAAAPSTPEVVAPEPSTSAAPAPSTKPSPVQAPYAPSAKELLESANAARLAGDARLAAGRYDTLRKNYRKDSRAGLAAFELGRIRLDSLGDAPGAVEAFDDAIALSPDASFREDVEARRVDALDAAGNRARCLAEQTAYLSRYPNGVHAKVVSARCRP